MLHTFSTLPAGLVALRSTTAPPGAPLPPRSDMPAAAPTAAHAPSDIAELKHLKVAELAKMARDLNIEAAGAMKKQDLIFAILQAQAKTAEEAKEEMEVGGEGTLEVLPDGFGF